MTTRREIAESESVIKERLEKAFTLSLRAIFNRIKREYARRYVARGQILDVSPYDIDFQQAFRRQYERVEDKFLGRIVGLNEDIISDSSKEMLESIGLMLASQNLIRAEQQADIVNMTNQQEVNRATQRAVSIVENPNDRALVAVTGVTLLTPRFSSRSESISMFETQVAAENTKNVEARAYSGESLADMKTWITVGDQRVRQTHREANGQTVTINEPFAVGNSLLQYPSDSSLGAELKEIINCRCSAVYQIRSKA